MRDRRDVEALQCNAGAAGRKSGSTVHNAYPIVIMATLEALLREGIKNQRRQLQRYVVARDSRFVCTLCESQQLQHPGWAGPEFNQDNILGHFKTKHREITIYSHEQFCNAKKRAQQASQPEITSKFAKIEKTTGVDQAVQLMRKLPGTPLSNFDLKVQNVSNVNAIVMPAALNFDGLHRYRMLVVNNMLPLLRSRSQESFFLEKSESGVTFSEKVE